jgi:hypothetical protein
MGSKPITQRAGTKYGSAPANQEVTVDAGGKDVARFPRMSPLKNSALIQGAGDVGYSKNKPIEFDMESFDLEKEEDSPAKQTGRGATYNETNKGKETTTTTKGDTETNYSGGGTFKNQEEKDWYDGEIKKRVDSGMSQEEAVQDYRNTNKIGTAKTTTSPDQTITSKEPDEVYEGKLYRKQTGVGTSSYGGRMDQRKSLNMTRKEKRVAIDAARQEMKAGNITREEFKKRKNQAKLDMANQRVKEFETLKKNREYQQQQGKGKGGEVRLDDVQKTFADDYSDAQQMAMGIAQQKAERVRNQAAAADAKSYFKAKAGLLTDDSFTIGGGLSDFKTNTPSLTKPKSLMYDLSSVGSNSPSSTQPFDGLSQEDQYTLARSGVQKRGYKMKGFGAKNK